MLGISQAILAGLDVEGAEEFFRGIAGALALGALIERFAESEGLFVFDENVARLGGEDEKLRGRWIERGGGPVGGAGAFRADALAFGGRRGIFFDDRTAGFGIQAAGPSHIVDEGPPVRKSPVRRSRT